MTPFSRRLENSAALGQTVVDLAAPEEEPVKVEDEVKTKIPTEIVAEDRMEADELTHVDVDVDAKLKAEVEDEVGADEQTQVGFGAGEQTHFDVGAGEQTQFEVDVVEKGEAGELTQFEVDVVEKGEAGERTQEERVGCDWVGFSGV